MIIYIILILCILIVYFKYKIKNKETFNNYKSVVITPNKLVYNPSNVIGNKSMISRYISDTLVKYFPLKSKIYNISNYDIIKQPEDSIKITTLYDFLKFNENSQNSMKFIMKLFNQKLTIISKNKKLKNLSEIRNQSIYVYSKNSSEYYILNLIKKYYQFNIKILPEGVKIYNIITMFKSNKNIENIGIFTHHPNKAIVDLIKFNNYSILAIDNIDKKVFENIISNLKIDSIESNLYYKYRNDMINTINNPIILICSENIDPKLTENLVSFIYNNFILIKKTSDIDILNNIKYFNLSDIFADKTELYDIHKGVEIFYKNYGYISSIDLNICRKTVSINNCSENNIRLNPYRIL